MMNLPLQGLKVLNTRPLSAAKELSMAIKAAGGIALNCPALLIKPVKTNKLRFIQTLHDIRIAVFISANAVHFGLKQLKERNISWPASIEVIAIGKKTAIALRKHHIHVSCQPEISDSEHLIQLSILQDIRNQSILLFKGKNGRTLIEQTLTDRGAKLTVAEVYKRGMPPYNKSKIDFIWHDNTIDIILFTSEQAMHNLFKMFGREAYQWLCDKPCLVISERLAKSATRLGIKHILISTPETVFDTLCHYNQGLIHGQQQ
ncbi:uroporphyrinogen-III synthase [Legionella israelensis]|nr:uroporphyrinogen-III synthase [Legionella israelensis]